MLYITVQSLKDHDWKALKSGSEFTLEDSMAYSYQDNTKLTNHTKSDKGF